VSRKKFDLIESIEVGALPPDMKARWREILQREHDLEEDRERLNEDTDFLFSQVKDFVQIDTSTGVTKSIRIEEDGHVFVDYCPCPKCQASLNGVTVVEAVEELNRRGEIPEEALEHVRRNAKALDMEQARGLHAKSRLN